MDSTAPSRSRFALALMALPMLAVALGCVWTMLTAVPRPSPGDDSGYYAWQMSWLADGDLDSGNQIRILGTNMFPDELTINGRHLVLNKYPTGLSQMILPFTAPAHWGVLACNRWLGTNFPEDGAAPAVVRAAIAGVGVWVIAGLLATMATLRRLGAGELAATGLTTAAWLGTAAFAYSWKLPLWSHGVGLAAVAIFHWLAMVQLTNPSHTARRRAWLAISAGLIAGLAVTVRPTNAVILLPAALYLLVSLLGERPWKTLAVLVVFGLIGTIPPLLVELGTRYTLYGNLFFNGYTHKGEHFVWPPEYVGNVLLHIPGPGVGHGNGVLVAHPVVIVAAAGLVLAFWRRKDPALGAYALAALLGVVGTVLLYGCWWFWNLGFSYGARWTADFLPVWAIGLLVFIQSVHSKPRRAAFYMLPLVVWSLAYCLGQMEPDFIRSLETPVATSTGP